jgi:hypothetical protein
MVIGDEPEVAALRKNGGFLLPRTVFEAERELSCDLIAASHLGQVAGSDRDAIQRAEHQKAVNKALSVAHRDRRRGRRNAGKNTGGSQQNAENAGAQNRHPLCPMPMEKEAAQPFRCGYRLGGLRNLLDGSRR